MTNPHGWRLVQLVEIMLEEGQPCRDYFSEINVVEWLMARLARWEDQGLVLVEKSETGTRYRWIETTGFESKEIDE